MTLSQGILVLILASVVCALVSTVLTGFYGGDKTVPLRKVYAKWYLPNLVIWAIVWAIFLLVTTGN